MSMDARGGLMPALWVLLFGCGCSSIDAPARPPNVILILVDDLGWTDLGFMGSDFYETPNIDRLANSGVRFMNAYAATTVCSPTRASVLTGKYPARLHVTDWIHGHARPWAKLRVPEWTEYLPLEEITLAEALRPLGYATASMGKWHLGDPPHYPKEQGFDINVAGYFRGQPPSYHAPYQIPTLEEGADGEYLTDRLAQEAAAFIEENQDRPFFLYLPFYTVHTPIQGKAEKIARYEAKAEALGEGRHRNPGYAAMIESLDEGVGHILDELDRLGLTEETLVLFTSDNGGLVLPLSDWGTITSNVPLREGKGSSYEGGVRVPLVIRWPGKAEPGREVAVPVISNDFVPTILEIVGAPEAAGIDGESLVPLLAGSGSLERDSLYWHYPHYHPGGATPYGAVRVGDFKLIEFYEDERVELYNLRDDPGESQDLAAELPEKTRELEERLENWRAQVGAQMPLGNPDYDPERAGTFTR